MGGIIMKKSISTVLAIILTLSTMTGCASKTTDTKPVDSVKKEKAIIGEE